MPWREVSALDQRREFVRLALQDGVNRRELCRRFGISPDVGYKWLARHIAGDADLEDRSRRPRRSPARSAIEALALAVRDAHPAWGAPQDRTLPFAGGACPSRGLDGSCDSAPSWAGRSARRQGGPAPSAVRNGGAQPALADGLQRPHAARRRRVLPSSDCDRRPFALRAVSGGLRQRAGRNVRTHLETAFRLYGLPEAMFVDNGGPWGFTLAEPWTRLGVWLLKLGVRLIHSPPAPP